MAFGFGGFGGSVNSNEASKAAGLPFAGVPPALQGRVTEALKREPEHDQPEVTFSHRSPDEASFGLWSFLQPYRGRLALAALMVIIETLALQAGPLLTQIGIDHGIIPKNTRVLVIVSAIFATAIIIQALIGRARINYTGSLGEGLMYQLRVRVFSHLQRQSLDFFTEEKAGVLMTRMTSDIDSLSILFQEGLVNFGVQALTLLVITVVLFILDPYLATITLLIVLPAAIVVTAWFRKVSERGYLRARDCIAAVLSDLQESLAGIRVISAHNRGAHNLETHHDVLRDFEDANRYTGGATSAYGPVTEAIGVAARIAVLVIGGRMVLRGELSIGELTAFALYLTQFFAPIQQLVQLYNTYQQGQAAVTKLRTLLGTDPSVLEALDAVELPELDGAISLRNVTFGYSADTPILSNINLELAAGESLAVVGPTGAGKSTVAKLISRFYDPQEGSVLLDGHDLRGVRIDSLRRQLGVVPQEPFLFQGTMRDNIAFADPDATDEEVWAAVRAVGVESLLASNPAGLDAIVHERGASLSAGERQLLALARAFMAKPRVLILDEATSNLDLRSEAQIEHALDVLLEGRTAIIIAHRLATAMRADRIAVVDSGEIVEIGSHDELVALGGQYAAMHATWMEHVGGDAG